MPTNFGQALGGGLLMSNELMQAARSANSRAAFMDAETQGRLLRNEQMQDERAAVKSRSEMLNQISQSLPPEERMLFNADPSAYVKSMTEGFTLAPDQIRQRGNKVIGVGIPAPVDSWSAPFMLGGQVVQKNDRTGQIRQAVNPPASTNVQLGFGAPVAVDTPQGPRLVLPPTKPGGQAEIVAIPGVGPITPQQKPKEPTDVERTAAGFADRMIAAESALSQIGEQGVPTYATGAAAVVGPTAERLTQTPQQQAYSQAQADWVRAKLRKESGAVIGEEEMKSEIRTYFPQPGDSPQVIEQKARARDTAIKGMLRSAGASAPTVGMPAVGEVRKGYRFKGGDPANQSSWEKVGG